MTREKQIIEEAERIIAEANERGNNNPMLDLAITLSFSLGARWADEHPRWISVEEIQPKKDEWFLGYSPLKSPLSSMKIDVYNFISFGQLEAHGITHWMPIPSVEHLKDKEL